MTGPGNPSDTRSNFQSRTDFLTTRTILRGVMPGPDGYFRGSFCPEASILMFVPPTSITRTLGDLRTCAVFIMNLKNCPTCATQRSRSLWDPYHVPPPPVGGHAPNAAQHLIITSSKIQRLWINSPLRCRHRRQDSSVEVRAQRALLKL